MSDSTTDDAASISRPADTMRERVGESRPKIWFLISANRFSVTGVFLLGTLVVLLVLGTFGPHSIRMLLTTDAAGTLFSSMIIAIVTSVTLVLTISQFVLSQEIGPLGKQRQRMQSAVDFREDVESASEIGPSPSDPSAFLRALVEATAAKAEALDDAATGSGDPEAAVKPITSYTDGLIEHSEQVIDQLEGAEFGSFAVLLPVLNYNYSWKIAAARSLRADHGDTISAETDDAFGELLRMLRFFGPAREHFKTLYFQWESVNLARAMLYAAMPALAVSAYMIIAFDPAAVAGVTAGIDTALLVVSVVFVVTLTPFAVLLAYLLRILTVAKRTLAIGPFVLRNSELSEDVR